MCTSIPCTTSEWRIANKSVKINSRREPNFCVCFFPVWWEVVHFLLAAPSTSVDFLMPRRFCFWFDPFGAEWNWKKKNICFFFRLQMKVAITILVVCVAACVADPELNSTSREKRQTQKPGRFLSLPIPAKCSTRKCCSMKLVHESRHVCDALAQGYSNRKSFNLDRFAIATCLLIPFETDSMKWFSGVRSTELHITNHKNSSYADTTRTKWTMEKFESRFVIYS